MNKICLLSITASHYRYRVYSEMQKEFDCDFIFGVDNTSVKRMDTTRLGNVINIPNRYLFRTQAYYQPKTLRNTKKYNIVINDLGIFSLSSWILLIFSKLRGQKIYHWDHGWYGRESLVKKIIKRLYFGLANGSFIYGDYAIDLMKKNGFNSNKLFPIHNSLDYESQLKLRKTMEHRPIYKEYFGNEYPVLMMIGRLNMRKNLHQLLEAVALLKSREKLFNVVLIGDGEDKPMLEAIANELGIKEQVWFYGACYDEAQNAELIYNSDMCVVPGDIGLTAIHAMTFGVPVVSHDYFPSQGPEFEVIKKGVTGSFFKHNDVQSLAEIIDLWFLAHKDDREVVREKCYAEIDMAWTPQYQIDVIKKAIGNE